MDNKEKALKAVELLENEYPQALCSLEYTEPLQLLIATRLAAQCTDKRVNMVTPALFERYKNVHDFANANVEEVITSVTEIMQSVVTGMVSTAIRDAEGDQVSVRTGGYVGYSGKQLLSDSLNRVEAAKALVERLGASSRDVMLIFFGEQVPQNEAESLVADLQTQHNNLEIMLNNGQQPIYDYIFVLC